MPNKTQVLEISFIIQCGDNLFIYDGSDLIVPYVLRGLEVKDVQSLFNFINHLPPHTVFTFPLSAVPYDNIETEFLYLNFGPQEDLAMFFSVRDFSSLSREESGEILHSLQASSFWKPFKA